MAVVARGTVQGGKPAHKLRETLGHGHMLVVTWLWLCWEWGPSSLQTNPPRAAMEIYTNPALYFIASCKGKYIRGFSCFNNGGYANNLGFRLKRIMILSAFYKMFCCLWMKSIQRKKGQFAMILKTCFLNTVRTMTEDKLRRNRNL